MVKFLEGDKGLLVVPESKEEKILLEKNDNHFLKFLEKHMNRLINETQTHKKSPTHRSDQTACV